MSAENVETVRDAYAAFSRGDFDGALAAAAPDVEFVSWWEQVEGGAGVFHGTEAVKEFWGQILATFDHWRVEVRDIVDAGDQVVAIVVTHASAGGVAVEQERGDIYTFEAGRVVRVVQNLTPPEALRAVGLTG